jgi:iron complex outermembrane receptor protein
MKANLKNPLLATLATFALIDAQGQSTNINPKQQAKTDATVPAGLTEAIVLSPFAVNAEKDVGYQGGNTTSGSRLNTSLKDTAAAVMVFTPEFLSDFSATSLADIVGYAPNMSVDMFETAPSVTTGFLTGSDRRETLIRVRGLPASTAMDFFETGIAIDNYNTERLELSSGPNSVLFGFGSPGGLVNLMSKRAQVSRNRTAFRTQFGEWDHRRVELDHNQVLLPGKLALRLNGLLQNSGGWRRWDFNDASRGALSLRANPWKNTSVIVNYENGQLRSHATRPFNAFDSLALWRAGGSARTSDAAWTTADRALGINRNTTASNYYITSGSGAAPFTLTTQNAANFRLLESSYENLNLAASARAGLTMVPASQVPFDLSPFGPGSSRDTNFDRLVTTVEQRLAKDVLLELAWNREISRQFVMVSQDVSLFGDPNAVIPNPNGSATPVTNPNAGSIYLQSHWVNDQGIVRNNVVRGSLAWDLNLGRLGRHKIAGMAEQGKLRSMRYPSDEILVDANGVPINNASLPENAVNQVLRRQYVVPGDFRTYYGGSGTANFTVERNGKIYHNTFVQRTTNGGDIERSMYTLLIATQSAFFDSRLVFTGGIRRDRITFDQHAGTRLSADDPEVKAGTKVLNEVRFAPGIASTTQFAPVTGTLGVVYHATRIASVFYNHANNNSQPSLNQRILPDEILPPPSDGLSDDYGFMFNLLDGRIFVRATAYQTSQAKATGGTFNIAGINGLIAPNTRILDALLAANRISASEYTQHLLGDQGNLAGTSDVVNRGYEFSTSFNVSPNLTALVNFSYTKTRRSAIVPEFDEWIEREEPFWHKTAGAGALVNGVSGLTVDGEATSIRNIMQDIRDFNNFGYGERPYKANASARYSFSTGILKGVFAGGGIRWQSSPKLGRAVTGVTPQGIRLFGETYSGPEDFKADAFLGYRRKLKIRESKPELTVQLNVTNLTAEDTVMPVRYNAIKSGYQTVMLAEPRKFRLTVGLDF